MELVRTVKDADNLSENKIIGNFKINNGRITFHGKNNILVFDDNININNAVFSFKGDNCLVYICSNLNSNFTLDLFHNSTVFIGKDASMGNGIVFNVQEGQNLIIGDDCMIGHKVIVYTSDYYPIYRSKDKKRINFSNSVFIGDHVWIGRFVHISKGNKIGSGSIISDESFLQSNQKFKSNVLISGNPGRVIEKDVFFVKDYVGSNKADDTLNSEKYISDVFIYNFTNQETLDLNKIDGILKKLTVDERLEFIQKLFIRNKRINRFVI